MLFVVLCLGIGLVSGCAGTKPTQPAPPAPKTDEPTKTGGKVIAGTPYGPTTFDPAYCTEEGGIDVMNHVFNALYSRNDKFQIIPNLALSHENPDPLTWVFHLREGVMWHDDNEVFPKGQSREVTAEDVKYTFERILDPESKSPRVGLISLVSKVEAVDSHTVKITTKQPDAFLIDNIPSVYIVPKEAVEKLGKEKFARNPIGSGPFKFVEFKPDSHVTLVRNDAYYDKAYLDELTMRVIPDQNVLLVSLETNDVQVNKLLPSPEVPRIREDSRFKTYPSPTYAYRYAAFNVRNPLFSDPELRRLLALALDIDAGIKAIFPEGVAVRAWGPVPPNIVGHDPTLEDLWKIDRSKILDELAALGWKPGTDGILAKGDQKLEFTIKAPSQDPNRTKFAVIIGQQWKELGIKAEVQTLEWGTLIDDMDKGNTDVYIVGGFSGASGMMFLFHTKNQGPPGNASFYSNKSVDELMDKGAITVDVAEREKIWKEAQRIIVSEFAHIPLYHEAWFSATSVKVNDFFPSFRFHSSQNNVWLTKN